MRLTKSTSHAMRILIECAQADERLVKVAELSTRLDITPQNVFKIVNMLTRAGLIAATRGRNGGVRLAKAADKITLFDVVRVTEDSFAMAECFENDAAECPLIDSCGLNEALRKALGAFFEVLEGYSIDDLIKARPNMRSLLGLEFEAPRALAG